MIEIVLAIGLGFAAGMLAGLFGVGGGILFVPTLIILFGLGQVEAQATSLLAILPTVAAGAWRQHAYSNVRWRAAAVIGTTAIVGVELGILVAKALPEQTLRRLFGVLVLAVAAQLAWRARRSILAP
ncbi:MAG TPA: sulfite exporter TauE/SafE family protein [Gaiellaceae bacterium]|nr:sulfite exporter TauE/SafE family protein [Gaiellaceae bacterium]